MKIKIKEAGFRTTDAERMELAKLLCYGMEWISGAGMDRESFKHNALYNEGGAETLAHLAACWICQKEFAGETSIETWEAEDGLRIKSSFNMKDTPEKMKTRIDKFIASFRGG